MYIYFKFPTTQESLFVNKKYEDALKYFRDNKFLSKEEIEFYLKKFEIFTSESEQELFSLENSDPLQYPSLPNFASKAEEGKYIESCMIEIIHGYKRIDLKNLFGNESESLNPAIKRYRELTSQKGYHTKNSSESLAESIKLNYLTYFCCYKDLNTKMWNSYKDYTDEKRQILVRAIQFKLVDFLSGFNSTVLRKIAKHPLWRTRWLGATKTATNLFSGTVASWDLNKLMLTYWSQFYDSIYNGYKVPDKFIIEDDKLLDAWLEQQVLESKSNRTDSADKDTSVAIFKNNINPVKRK